MKILILVLTILSTSCATTTTTHESNVPERFSEKMLPNGDWQLAFFSEYSCQDKLDEIEGNKGLFNKSLGEIIHPKKFEDAEATKKCKRMFEGKLAARAVNLCESGKFNLYGCLTINEATPPLDGTGEKLVLSCYSKCK